MGTNLRLDWCSYQAAKYAVENWHYSKSMPTPPVLKIGVWENNKFMGCVLFSRGNSTNLGKSYGLKIEEVCELSRIALTNHKTPVSRIISIAVKMLKEKEKGLRLIVSFADVNQGHHGGIYQGSNWIYTGTTGISYKFIYKGKEYHSRQVASNGINFQYGERRKVPKISDCVRIKLKPKHRYLMPLDKEMCKKIEPLRKPYPKKIIADKEKNGSPQANEEMAV